MIATKKNNVNNPAESLDFDIFAGMILSKFDEWLETSQDYLTQNKELAEAFCTAYGVSSNSLATKLFMGFYGGMEAGVEIYEAIIGLDPESENESGDNNHDNIG